MRLHPPDASKSNIIPWSIYCRDDPVVVINKDMLLAHMPMPLSDFCVQTVKYQLFFQATKQQSAGRAGASQVHLAHRAATAGDGVPSGHPAYECGALRSAAAA